MLVFSLSKQVTFIWHCFASRCLALHFIDLHREALHGSVSITNISSVGREIEYFKVLMLYPDTAIFTVS